MDVVQSQLDIDPIERIARRQPTSRLSLRTTCNLVAIVLILGAAGLLAGCAGSTVGSGFVTEGRSPSSRTALTEQMYRTCVKETTPLLARPTSPLADKCECAAVAFHNYATDAQVDDMKQIWGLYGHGTEFSHKVLGSTESFYMTHCGIRQDNGEQALRLTSLRTGRTEADDATPTEKAMVTEEIDPAVPLASVSTGDGIVRYALGPSALNDRDLVRYLQRKLKGLGYDPGPLDGVVGPKTRMALDAYGKSQAMPEGTSHEDIMSALLF